MDLLVPHCHILADFTHVAVAEWSKASDHFRSFGQKLRWGPGDKNFFFLFFVFFDSLECRYNLFLHDIQI